MVYSFKEYIKIVKGAIKLLTLCPPQKQAKTQPTF